MASYHLSNDPKSGSFVSYASAPDSWELENGKKLPNLIYFDDPQYDVITRTFTGTI